MLAVVGSPSFMPGSMPDAAADAGGLAAGIARAAAAAGAEVQLIGKVGDDPAGDAVLLALARGGVGHIALLRDAGRATPIASPAAVEVDPVEAEPIAALLAEAEAADRRDVSLGEGATPPAPGLALEPADISLGLRYVREFRVLVAAEPLDEPSAAVVADAAAFADAALVVIAPRGQATSAELATAIVLEAPEVDPDGVFAVLVGRFAAALDRGLDAADAFRAATVEGGWERAAS
jgi:ribokinase